MTDHARFKLAAIQASAVPFDREASAEKACRLIREAGAMGATIAAFGEAWLPGYPFFAHAPTTPLTFQAMAEYLANAVEIPGPITDRPGFGFLPGFALKLPRKHPTIRALPVALPNTRHPIAIITLKNRSLSPLAQLFIEQVRVLTKPLAKMK